MSCKGCATKSTSSTARDFTLLEPLAERILCSDRKYYSINAPLCKKPPRAGWSVDAIVGGSAVHVTGKNAPEVVRHLFAIYAQNGIDVDMTTLWYNANLSWLQRSLSFDRRCSYEDLLSLSQEPEEDDDLYTPLEWGGLAWKFAALYLSKSSFDEQRFQQILQALKDLVSDESIGCAECHDHFTDRLLRFPDLTTQQKAREWLWTTINEIRRENNKPTLTFEQASSLHHWR